MGFSGVGEVAFGEVAKQGAGAEGLSGGGDDEFLGIEAFAAAVDLVAEPGQEARELASREILRETGQLAEGVIPELGGDHVAEGVAGEVTEGTAGPVNVLEHAVGIIGRRDPEQILGETIPLAREIGDRKAAFEEGHFEVEAHEDMEIVGHFVGIDPYGARADVIDGGEKFGAGDRGELRAEMESQAGLEKGPELGASSDLVFPEAALGFVDGHADRLAERGADVGLGQALFVERVAGLVDRAEDGVEGVVFVKAGGQARVEGIAAAERVEGCVEATAIPVKANSIECLAYELPLCGDGESSEHVWRGGGSGGGDSPGEGGELAPETGEEGGDECGVEAGVVEVDRIVVGPVAPAHEFGLAARHHDLALEEWGEGRKIRILPRPGPCVEGGAVEGGLLSDEVLGEAGGTVEVSPGMTNDHVGVGARREIARLEYREKPADLGIGGCGVMDGGQFLELLGAAVGAVGREIDLLIPVKDAEDRAEDIDPFEPCDELVVGGVWHVCALQRVDAR